MKTLDIVVPTYNRKDLLRRTIQSVQRAERPGGLLVTLIVVDNNCTDGTEEMVKEMARVSPLPIRWVREIKQGLSCARNRGIAEGSSDLIGFIDDDEEIRSDWLAVVDREFRDPDVSFIGGPYAPRWGAAPPKWLPQSMPAIVGIVEARPRSPYDAQFPGILMGGNAVLRRRVFENIGNFDSRLGRTNKGLLSMEDDELYQRLLSAGIQGTHVPDLVIDHYIPQSRLTRKYHRRWCFSHGISMGIMDWSRPMKVAYCCGIPRYFLGDVLRKLCWMVAYRLTGRPEKAFEAELTLWNVMGFIYGKTRHGGAGC